MADQLTEAHHEWVRRFTDGAIDPSRTSTAAAPGAPPGGSAPGGAATPDGPGPVFHVAIYSDHAGTAKIMALCDTIHSSGAKEVMIQGKPHAVASVLQPIAQQIEKSVSFIRAMNIESERDAAKLMHDERGIAWISAKFAGISAATTQKNVTDAAAKSYSHLHAAEQSLKSGGYAKSYSNLIDGINEGFKARSAISAYDAGLVTGAERVVKGTTWVRDGSFTALALLSGVAEVGIVVGTGIALMPAAADLYTKAMTGEKINWASAGADVLLTVLENKFAGPLGEKLKGVCGPAVKKALTKLPGTVHLTPEQEAKVIEFVADKLKSAGHTLFQTSAGSFCKEQGKKPLSYKEAAEEFIKTHVTVDAAEHFVSTLLLSQALATVGIKLDAHNKAAAAAP